MIDLKPLILKVLGGETVLSTPELRKIMRKTDTHKFTKYELNKTLYDMEKLGLVEKTFTNMMTYWKLKYPLNNQSINE